MGGERKVTSRAEVIPNERATYGTEKITPESILEERNRALTYSFMEDEDAFGDELVEALKSEQAFAVQSNADTVATTIRYSALRPDGKFILINDLHIPYVSLEILEMVLKEQADGLIINGDFLDAERLSKFSGRKRVSFETEFLLGAEVLKELASHYPLVILLPGNHERRLTKKFFRDSSSDEFGFMFTPDPLYHLATGYINKDGHNIKYHDFSNVIYYDNALKFGNVIFDHPDHYSSVPGGSIRRSIQHFLSLGVDFDVAIMGHTHQFAEITELGRIGIESGAACIEQPYQYTTGVRRRSTHVQMYMRLYFDNGKMVSYEKVLPAQRR